MGKKRRKKQGDAARGQASRSADDIAWGRQIQRLKLDYRYSLFRTGMRLLALVLVFMFLWGIVVVLAGKNTSFIAVVHFMSKVRTDKWTLYSLLVLTSGGWGAERTLRQRTIKKREKYIRDLEQRIDPKRTSSGLQPSGKPRKEDVDAL